MHCGLLNRRRSLFTLSVGSLVTTLLANGCLGAERHGSLGAAEQAVVDGEPDSDSPAVVYLPGCTGTLIAPNLVLTALHCVAPITGDNNFSCTLEGDLENPPNGQLGAHLDPASITVTLGAAFSNTQDAVGVEILSTQSTQICQNDLAFVVLDRHLDQPIAPVRLDRPVAMGELLTVVGYGLTANPADLPPGEKVARRRRDNVPVVAIGSTLAEPDGEEALPRTFALGESVCKGDSGGPALSQDGAVVGVYSTFVGGCTGPGARNFYTMLSEFKPLVLQAYELANATPWLEGQVSPGVGIEGEVSSDGGVGALQSLPPPRPPSSKGAASNGYCSVGFGKTQPGPHNSPNSLNWFGAIGAALAAARRRTSTRKSREV